MLGVTDMDRNTYMSSCVDARERLPRRKLNRSPLHPNSPSRESSKSQGNLRLLRKNPELRYGVVLLRNPLRAGTRRQVPDATMVLRLAAMVNLTLPWVLHAKFVPAPS